MSPTGAGTCSRREAAASGTSEVVAVGEPEGLLVEAPGPVEIGDAQAHVVDEAHAGIVRAELTSASPSTASDLFLPEPEPREVLATIISVDDHLVEPTACSTAVTLPALGPKIGYPSIEEY